VRRFASTISNPPTKARGGIRTLTISSYPVFVRLPRCNDLISSMELDREVISHEVVAAFCSSQRNLNRLMDHLIVAEFVQDNAKQLYFVSADIESGPLMQTNPA
jgi:hypothetical protein